MRPPKDQTWLEVAKVLAGQSTCLRRSVGCVLIDRHGEVDGTGWNGVASGQPHCNESLIMTAIEVSSWKGPPLTVTWENDKRRVNPYACPGARSPSGTNLDGCEALHAEQNALSQCTDKWGLIVCYVTHSPCMTCTKLLLNTGVMSIVFVEEYAHNEAAKALWERAGRTWIKYDK